MAESTATILSRDSLTNVKNLFVLNPANISYLQGTSTRPFGAPTMTGLLVFLVLAAILGGCPLAGAASTSDSGSLIGVALILGIPCLLGAAWAYRRYRRAVRLEKGVLLQATITGVSARERSKASSTGLNLLAIALLILDLISIFDSSSRTTTTSSGYAPGDFYELSLQFTAAAPSGTQIGGTARQNRPDLRSGILPHVGDPLVVLYVDDVLYQVM